VLSTEHYLLFLKDLLNSIRPRALGLVWPVLMVGGLAAGCSSETELLNSERIELRYGNYGVRILHADQQQRVTSLYSTGIEGEVCRTLAIVDFVRPLDSRLAAEHSSILAGASIGQVFRQAGWQTEKYTLSVRETRAGDHNAQIPELMHLDPTETLAVHRYRFEVIQGELRIPYAIITEIHHPDYLTVQQLHQIYD
jgi:hypothetical protein